MAPHNKKNLDDIQLEDVDFELVKECNCKDVVKKYIKLLMDDGDHFKELLQACKDKLLELDPKGYYLLYPRQTTAKEIDEVTQDLLDWEASVKETDALLKASRKQKIWDDVPGVGVLAPIRGQEAAVPARANLQRKEVIKDQAEKLTGKNADYARDKTKMKDYYRSWDSIDVDAIEADMDQDEVDAEEARKKHFGDMREEQEEAHRSSPVKTGNLPENVPEAHRKHMADSEKEKGNEAFYSKDYAEAEAYYARSLHFRPDDPSCWANRGLSRLKLDNARGALEDCEHALAINPRYMKALHRKGKALYELERYEEAVQSFQLALMESPGNTQINGDLMVARRKLRSGPSPTPQPKSFAPSSRVGGPREEASCFIEEVFDDEEEEIVCDAAPVAPAKPAAPAGPAVGYTRVQIEDDSDSEEDESPPINQAGFHKVQIQEDSDSEEDGEPEREPAAVLPPAPAPAAPARTGFHKVQIVDESDSEEEEACGKAVAPAEEQLNFEDMD